MHVTITDNVPAALRYMSEVEKKAVGWAYIRALTETAQLVKIAELGMLPNIFDRPTPYTMNSMGIRIATRQNPSAEVFFKTGSHTPASNYLQPHVRGGSRKQKRSERALANRGLLGNKGFWVPGRGAKLDAYGNIRGSQWTKMLSDLQITSDPMQWRNRSKKAGQYFVPQQGSKLPAGIYERFGTGGRNIRPIAIFVTDVNYQKRFDFYGIAHRVATREFPAKFAKQLDLELSRLKTP